MGKYPNTQGKHAYTSYNQVSVEFILKSIIVNPDEAVVSLCPYYRTSMGMSGCTKNSDCQRCIVDG